MVIIDDRCEDRKKIGFCSGCNMIAKSSLVNRMCNSILTSRCVDYWMAEYRTCSEVKAISWLLNDWIHTEPVLKLKPYFIFHHTWFTWNHELLRYLWKMLTWENLHIYIGSEVNIGNKLHLTTEFETLISTSNLPLLSWELRQILNWLGRSFWELEKSFFNMCTVKAPTKSEPKFLTL